MRVIGEFKDLRNGKRYLPGDGNKISPALEADQVKRLIAAGCLAEGEEAVAAKAPLAKTDEEGTDTPDYTAMSVNALKELASGRKLDLAGVKSKADLIALLQEADSDAEAACQQQAAGGEAQQ